MRKTYYYCYDMEEKKDWLRQSMQELPQCLALLPAEVNYRFTELPQEYEDDVCEIFETTPESVHSWEVDLLRYYSEKQKCISSTLVICTKTSALAKICLEASTNALWGLATSTLAIVYGIYDKYSVWHEMLHLLGADDCYDLSKSDRGPNCDCPNCIMQYEATKANVGDWPFICDANIQRIQRRITEWKK